MSEKQFCKRGHILTPDNLFTTKRTDRNNLRKQCRLCKNIRRAAWAQRHPSYRKKWLKKYRVKKGMCEKGHPKIGKNRLPSGGCRICLQRRTKRRAAYFAHRRYLKLQVIRQAVLGAKLAPCQRCGDSYLPCAMEFHHRDPKTKLFAISKRPYSYKKTLAEIAKCDLLCANCHRIVEFETREKVVDITTEL